MYHPYFRGRQNELIVIREKAELLARSRFVPIVEPVKAATNGLIRALTELSRFDGQAVVVLNPENGDFKDNPDKVRRLLANELGDISGLSAGVRVSPTTPLQHIKDLCRQLSQRPLTILHCGFPDAKKVAETLVESPVARHVFLDESCSKLYRKHFRSSDRILIRDGFTKRTNREHPIRESFSDLHVTFGEEGMAGFGDFLIVGNEYQESGGPAYAVAIHITYIDSEQDDEMFVMHFVSDRTDTTQDPAGKFGEALEKLVREVERNTRIRKTEAVKELLDLHRQGHFPGLGYVKKLSMQHHIETLSAYFSAHGRQRS